MATIPEIRRAIRLELGRGQARRFRRLAHRLDARFDREFEFRTIYKFGSALPAEIDASERLDPGGPVATVHQTQPPWRGVRAAIRRVIDRVAEQVRLAEEREAEKQKLLESRK